jgi:hypothetical protein
MMQLAIKALVSKAKAPIYGRSAPLPVLPAIGHAISRDWLF